jgi:hypothetical protein
MLVAWATGRQPEVPPELRAAGLIDERGKLHTRLSASVKAISDPVCRVTTRIQDAGGRRQAHDGWVASAAAALLLGPDGNDHRYELANLHPAFLPEAIARLVGLGPRHRSVDAGPILLSPALLDDLTSPDAARRDTALNPVRSSAPHSMGQVTAQALGGRVIARWEAVATWEASRGSSGRRGIHVIDTTAGLWLVEPLSVDLLASPTTPSVVWRLLTTLLPRDDELGYSPGGRRPARPMLGI